MRSIRRVVVSGLVGVVLVGAGLVGVAPGAAADCSGPVVSLGSTVVDRGQLFVVAGQAIGDNCYDTGPPPEGEGTLGRPLEDLQVVIVQGGAEAVLAEGDADDRYAFSTNAVVPGTFAPGPATIELRHDGDLVWSSEFVDLPFRISDAPTGDVHWGVATFTWEGPAPTTTVAPDSITVIGRSSGPSAGSAGSSVTESDDASVLVPGLIGGAVGAVLASLVALVAAGRRRRGAAKMG